MRLVRLAWFTAIPAAFLLFWASGTVPVGIEVVAIIGICFACELMDSSLGMGYGTTLTPVLLLMGYAPIQLVPTILLSELLSGFSAAMFHAGEGNVAFRWGSRHLRVAVILSLGSVVGVAVGVNLAVAISKETLTLVIGAIIFGAGLVIGYRIYRPAKYRSWKMLILATVASFNKAVSGGGYGPLLTSGQVLSGLDGKAAVAITSLSEAFTCLGGVTLFLLAGERLTVELLVPVLTGALLSVPLSANLVRRVSDRLLRRGIAVFTLLFGALILFKGISG